MKQLKIFWWGLAISFLGSIPLGTMNVTATNVAVTQGIMAGWYFALGATVLEIVYVRLALVAMDKVMKRQRVFKAFGWLTVLLLFVLSFASILAAIHMKGLGATVPSYAFTPFVLGMFLSLINPLHIPFWFGWSTVLIEKNILVPSRSSYNAYVSGMAVGSMVGFAVFIYGSHFAMSQVKTNQHLINYTIGFILLLTACIQMYKLLPQRLSFRPSLARQ